MGAVYRKELSANARKLIEQLLSLPQGWVTAAALAESIGVSRRTVLRELPAVEQWMQAAGAHFVRNPGKGLLLDEAPERRDALRTQLNSGDRKELSRAERRQQLLTRLLSEQEPCKTAVLARALGVSESTLSADLDELETKLHPYRACSVTPSPSPFLRILPSAPTTISAAGAGWPTRCGILSWPRSRVKTPRIFMLPPSIRSR